MDSRKQHMAAAVEAEVAEAEAPRVGIMAPQGAPRRIPRPVPPYSFRPLPLLTSVQHRRVRAR